MISKPLLVALALYVPIAPAFGQSSKANGAAASAAAADAQWQTLLDANAKTPSSNASAAALVATADQFKAFADNNPSNGHAKEAKGYEGVLLYRAAFLGEKANSGRRNAIAAQARNDKTMPDVLRAEIFASADTLDVLASNITDPAARLAQFEKGARALIAEFPNLQNGYEALLAVATNGSDASGAALAPEIAAMTGAPAWIKAEAQTAVARFALIGTDLAKAGITVAPGGKQPVVVYSWTKAGDGGVALAKLLAKNLPTAKLIGVCLDPDAAAAKQAAASGSAPGEQVLDLAVAKKLLLTQPGYAYGADANGKIRSVSLQNDLGAAFLATQK